jgi:hypothetical protein
MSLNMDDVDMVAKLVATIEKNARVAAAKAASKTYPLTWVKLDRYVELSGDSMDAVQARRRLGKWIDGTQCKIVDGRLWVNLPAVEEWIEKWDARSPPLALLPSTRRPSKPKK